MLLQEYQSDFLGHSHYRMGQGIKKRWRISYWYMHDVFYEPRVVQLKGFRSVQLLDNTWCIQELAHCAIWNVIEGCNKSSTTSRYWILLPLYDSTSIVLDKPNLEPQYLELSHHFIFLPFVNNQESFMCTEQTHVDFPFNNSFACVILQYLKV